MPGSHGATKQEHQFKPQIDRYRPADRTHPTKSISKITVYRGLHDAEIQLIPLNKLILSPKNVRKTPASEAEDAELYASIKAKSIKQNLLVHAVGAKFHVHAGGRRLKMLQRLAEEKHIKANHPVACKVEDSDEAEDTSTTENMIRSSMHPADQFEAFATLAPRDGPRIRSQPSTDSQPIWSDAVLNWPASHRN